MMMEWKTVGVEVFICAADRAAIWMKGTDAVRYGPLPAANTVHFEVQRLLVEAGVDPDDEAVFIKLPDAPVAGVVHSTSWRDAGPAVVLTYMAVVAVDGFVLGAWPDAVPVTPVLLAKTAKPLPHRPAGPPREVFVSHVLEHGLRHLAFQTGKWGDANIAAVLDRNMRRHLAQLKPGMAGMYSELLAG
jgi:hypothetical protein